MVTVAQPEEQSICNRPIEGPNPSRHPPNSREPLYTAFRLFFLGLFQYGDLHLGQTLGSPTVLSRGTHSCSQRPHLYPFCLIVTNPMLVYYQISIDCQGKNLENNP